MLVSVSCDSLRVASVFWRDSEQHHERQCLSLLFDMTDPNQSPRELRGVTLITLLTRFLALRDA